MISSIIETNNELTKYIITSFKQNNMPVNELVLQKVVYKIKMDLGEDHQLYDNLPFYWHCYGPFSETIRQSFVDIKKFLTPVGDGFLVGDFKSDIQVNFPKLMIQFLI